MSDPFLVEGPAVLAVSGGRSSMKMLRLVLDAHGGELPGDVHAVFCNTGMERAETLEFVNECALRWGVPIVWLERDPDESGTIPCTCTDRREPRRWRCSCGKRPGEGHTLLCSMRRDDARRAA